MCAELEQEWKLRKEDDEVIKSELLKVGIKVNSVFDLVNTRNPYPEAIPVLLNLVQYDFNSDWMKEGVIRALTVKEAKGIAGPILIDLFYKLPSNKMGIKWAIGNAMTIVMTKNDVEDLIKILKDKENGRSRQMFAKAMGKFKSEEAEKILIELLDDKYCVLTALSSLSKFKSTKAIEKVKLMVNNEDIDIRNAAKKYLTKMKVNV